MDDDHRKKPKNGPSPVYPQPTMSLPHSMTLLKSVQSDILLAASRLLWSVRLTRIEHVECRVGMRMGKRLSLERERRTDLVCRLVEVLGVQRGAEAQGDAGAELDVVSKSGDTAVVDLGLE